MADLQVPWSAIPLLSSLDETEIGVLAGLGRLLEVERDRLVFAEGDAGDEMYIVLSGTVAARGSLPDGSQRDVATFLPGDFFGEMGIFEGRQRSASCRTTAPTRLLRLTEEALRLFGQTRPEAAVRLLGALAAIVTRRLREKSGLLGSMVDWGEQAARRAFTDDTTGAYNRRYFDHALADGAEAARRGGAPLAVVMADVDNFRRTNESLPPPAGDTALREVTGLFRQHLREADTLARYGGDELALVLPGRTGQEAAAVCERIRLAVVSSPRWRELGAPDGLTVSLGCAAAVGEAADPADLLRRADDALYRAKRSGKNAVACDG